MESVRYFIPTRGRVGRQITLTNLPEDLHPLVTLVCPEDEVTQHSSEWPLVRVVAQPATIRTIGEKREWIYRVAAVGTEFAWQLDDDLSMKICIENRFVDVKKFPEATLDYFRFVEPMRREHYQVLGMGTSYFAPKGGVRDNYHLGFAFGFSRTAREKLVMNRMDVFEDIDYTLQMLRLGVRLAVCYDVVVDQRLPDAPGGVSGERDSSTIRRDLQRLVELHPGIVSEKPLKVGAHPAAVTRVAWAKAAKQGGL